MRYVLDAGALVAVDRGAASAWRLLDRAERADADPVTSSAVVAQVWRGGPRQARLAMVLRGVQIEPLTPDVGRELGVLLDRSGTSDVIDAHVAWLAQPGDVILTSAPDDLTTLVDARQIAAAVRRV